LIWLIHWTPLTVDTFLPAPAHARLILRLLTAFLRAPGLLRYRYRIFCTLNAWIAYADFAAHDFGSCHHLLPRGYRRPYLRRWTFITTVTRYRTPLVTFLDSATTTFTVYRSCAVVPTAHDLTLRLRSPFCSLFAHLRGCLPFWIVRLTTHALLHVTAWFVLPVYLDVLRTFCTQYLPFITRPRFTLVLYRFRCTRDTRTRLVTFG